MTTEYFNGIDLSDFWDDCDYALEEYVEEEPSDQLINSIEQELGYKLPSSYITLMKLHNGGIPKNTCFPTNESTSWAEDHIAITGISGIGRSKNYSLGGKFGSQFMIDEWGYPPIGICICSCPSAGHDMVMLDYSKNGPEGEPEVVHVDQENDYKISFLAKDFNSFIKGLVSEDHFDTLEEDRQSSLESFRTGKFSDLLQSFMQKEKIDFDSALRNLFTEITRAKGCFSLHDDKNSYLAYDIQFYLYSQNHKVKSRDEYLMAYPSMIVFGNNEMNTGGYAEDFVKDWWDERIANKQIKKKYFGGYVCSTNYKDEILRSVRNLL